MRGQKEAYASLTFKRDKYAWLFLILFVLVFAWVTGAFRAANPVYLRAWKTPVSNQSTLTILEYDRVVKKKSEGFVYEDQLRRHLNILAEDGFEAVSIEDVYAFYYKDAVLPERSILLIFANGYLETYSVVDPILRENEWPAAVTIITSTIVQRETFFLYWDRLQRMVGGGIWGLISGGHHRREGVTDSSRLMNGFHTLKVWMDKGKRQEIDHENSASIPKDYKVSRDLIEKYIPGYKTLAYSPRVGDSQSHIKNDKSRAKKNQPLKQLFKLGFTDSYVGVNDQRSDPFRLRRLRVQPGWQPETLLALTKKAISATADTRPKAVQKESVWMTGKGELLETSIHSNIVSGKELSNLNIQSEELETHLHGKPGAAIFMLGGSRADHWILDADFRLDQGEFWLRQHSLQGGGEWRLGGNKNSLNLQYKSTIGKYINLASFTRGIPLKVWQELKLIKRGKGIIVSLNNETLWSLPIPLPVDVKGDIAIQVWSREGEGSMRLKNAKVSFIPENIRWLGADPKEKEVQGLIQNAESVSGLTTVTHVVQGSQLKSVSYDQDLFQILCHRYGWKFIPTIRFLPAKHSSLPSENANGVTTEIAEVVNSWKSKIQSLVMQNQWTQVHLDLSKKTSEIKPKLYASLSELKDDLNKIDCQLFITFEGRPRISQALNLHQLSYDPDLKPGWTVAKGWH